MNSIEQEINSVVDEHPMAASPDRTNIICSWLGAFHSIISGKDLVLGAKVSKHAMNLLGKCIEFCCANPVSYCPL